MLTKNQELIDGLKKIGLPVIVKDNEIIISSNNLNNSTKPSTYEESKTK